MLKGLKFERSKYPTFKIAFCVFLFATVFLFLKMFAANLYAFNVKPFGYPLKSVAVNLTSKKPLERGAFICFNDYCKSLTNNHVLGVNVPLSNVYSAEYNASDFAFTKGRLKNIYFAYPKNSKIKNNIEEVVIYNGVDVKRYYAKDIEKLRSDETEIKIEDKDEVQKYNVIAFENINNYKGVFNHILNLFLALFCNWSDFIIPYFWLIFTAVFYIFKKEEIGFEIKFDKKYLYWSLGLITFVAACLRFNEINLYPLWFDEIYTKTIATKTLATTFADAGNPPMFYILEYLVSKISATDFAYRFLPMLFGVLLIPTVFMLFRRMGEKFALFAAFMAAVNSIFIYSSLEARAYSMCAFVGILSIYYLFKYLENSNLKNLIYFIVVSMVAINTHYMLVFFALGNLIWGIFDLIENKKHKELIKFVSLNLLAFLTFVPYFVMNVQNALSLTFNSWILPLKWVSFSKIIQQYFANMYIFYIVIALVLIMYLISLLPQKAKEDMKMSIDKNKENMFNYLSFSIAFVLLVSAVISYYIKPIMYPRAMGAVYFLLFALEMIIISTIFDFSKLKNKFALAFKTLYGIVLVFLVFSITSPQIMREEYILNNFMEFIKSDSVKYPKDYKVHAVIIDEKGYLDYFPEIKKMDIDWHFVNINGGRFQAKVNKDEYVKGKQKAVVYFSGLTTDFFMTNLIHQNMKIYITNSTNNGKIVFE